MKNKYLVLYINLLGGFKSKTRIVDWSEQAFEKFEELTACAKWKVMQARLEGYDGDRPSLTLIDTSATQVC